MQQFGHQRLSLVGPCREFRAAVVPAGLVAGQVGHHRTQGSTQRAHVGRNRSTSGGRTLTGGLFSKALDGHVDEALGCGRSAAHCSVLQKIFDDFLARIEGSQVVQAHRLDGELDDVLLGDARRTVLLLQIVAAGLYEHPLGNESHYLGARDADATVLGTAAHLVEALVQWSDIDVGDVHRHLGNAILVNIPANGLGAFQRAGLHDDVAVGITLRRTRNGVALTDGAPLLTNVEGNGVGATGRRGVEVIVDSDEEVAGANHRTARACHVFIEGTGTEVRLFLRVGDALGDALILATATDGQVLALRAEGCSLIAVARDAQLRGNALGQLAGQCGTLLQGDAADGNQRQHIGSADTGMGAMMAAHVYQLARRLHGTESGLADSLRLADKGDDGAVGGLAGVYVEQQHALDTFHSTGYLFDDFWIAPFAEIRYAFNKLF